jgi:hypothetical protein
VIADIVDWFKERNIRDMVTVFLANCQITAIAFSGEAQSPQLSIF